MDNDDIKRLFFAVEVASPWPERLPRGRLLPEAARHATLAFLGNTSWSKLEALLPGFPAPWFRVGQVGKFDKSLFLPPRRPRVVAWHVDWFEDDALPQYQETLASWLRECGYALDDRPFLPHVTLARWPFNVKDWKHSFAELPMAVTGLHLYESVGGLNYVPRWSYPLVPPIEALDHTADVAFTIRAENMLQLQLHAQVAMAFESPKLLPFFPEVVPGHEALEDIIIDLNDIVTRADSEVGCPFKAVSFHGEVKEDAHGVLSWEMIVDV